MSFDTDILQAIKTVVSEGDRISPPPQALVFGFLPALRAMVTPCRLVAHG